MAVIAENDILNICKGFINHIDFFFHSARKLLCWVIAADIVF